MRVLVTGATGFIGANLVRELLHRGDTVHILCRPSSDISVLDAQRVCVYRGELNMEDIARSMAGCDAVFHLAAYARNWSKDPADFHRVNVAGTKAVLDAVRECGVRRMVYTSSNLTLSPSNGFVPNEATPRTVPFFTEYERSKAKAEMVILEHVNEGMDVVIVNPTRVFGPGLMSEGNSVTRLIQMYLRGKMRVVLGDGNMRGNYGFVDDVVRGHVLALEKGRAGERYILGGENVSFNIFFNVLSDISTKSRTMAHIPESLAMGFAWFEGLRAKLSGHYPLITPEWLQLFVADWACSTEKAEREIGYRVTPLREALAKTIKWLQDGAHETKNSEHVS